ncbi:LacI family DNA-binding transcriptional regulator [Candidatus Enterococcus ikei]|uniref:LacI family DNA-binding transcriptional regulator n=1 Tax=Candidatus Enterococcus ikei TaxID=2815326 RepID=A0ABS3H0U2_9ENTE|nr:LacI family DNA-binding transcriptional regulator [Enterococcus sp. DIV0869a]MBO0441127.1 LacI family DNA-binding transcriptional regulator [Enterococcus sp. DIV0869a]
MANIRDIAKLSGYSVTTVSRVLNNHPYVSEEKRQKILKIMHELDYIPNAKARDLSSGKSKHIAVMIPYANHPYSDKIVSGILNAAFEDGYKVTLLPTNYDPKVEKHYLDELAAKAWDGMIITSKKVSFETIARYLKYAPIVCCEDTGDFPISCVSIKRETSYVDLFTSLKKQGYHKIGLTVGRTEKESASTGLVLQAYSDIIGYSDESMIVRNCRTYEDGIQAGLHFSKVKELEVIVTNGDDVAAGILQHVSLDEVTVIGEENLLSSRLLNFSTIDHHIDQCGEAAFHLLWEEKSRTVSIPYTFIERG